MAAKISGVKLESGADFRRKGCCEGDGRREKERENKMSEGGRERGGKGGKVGRERERERIEERQREMVIFWYGFWR